MKYFEFGSENPELMVMLHGGGTSYLGMLPTANKMAKVYHVVLVAYDGFNPDEPETEFVSPMDEAKRLGDHIVEHYGGKIDILYGISYGCRVLMEVLSATRLTITTTIADGMSLRDFRTSKANGARMFIAFSSRVFFTRSWDIRDRDEKNFLRRSPGERPMKPSGSFTARRRGTVGRTRITILSARRPTIRCLKKRICTSGTG